MITKRFLLFFLFVGLGIGLLGAQSNAVMDDFLGQKTAKVGPTTYLVLTAAKVFPESVTPTQAVLAAQSKKWLPDSIKEDSEIQAQDFAFLLMQSFKLSGGIMYTLAPSPWYAVKELNATGRFPNNRKFGESLTPFEVVQCLSGVLEVQGAAP